jgi:hypothetical protein
VDAWIFQQQSLVNGRTRSLVPVLTQRQALAEHLAKLLDRLGLDRVRAKAKTLHELVRERHDAPRIAKEGSREGWVAGNAVDAIDAADPWLVADGSPKLPAGQRPKPVEANGRSLARRATSPGSGTA